MILYYYIITLLYYIIYIIYYVIILNYVLHYYILYYMERRWHIRQRAGNKEQNDRSEDREFVSCVG